MALYNVSTPYYDKIASSTLNSNVVSVLKEFYSVMGSIVTYDNSPKNYPEIEIFMATNCEVDEVTWSEYKIRSSSSTLLIHLYFGYSQVRINKKDVQFTAVYDLTYLLDNSMMLLGFNGGSILAWSEAMMDTSGSGYTIGVSSKITDVSSYITDVMFLVASIGI